MIYINLIGQLYYTMNVVVLLTGATGFLGKYLLSDFSDHDLRVITRNPQNIDNQAIQVVKADIGKELPEGIFDDVDIFLHSAAKVGNWPKNKMKGYYQSNVVATKNLMENAIKNDVEKIIYTSSYFALGATGDQPATETWDNPPEFKHPYVETKYEAGKIVDELAMEYPILQLLPTVIMGPGIQNVISDNLIDYLNGRLIGLPNGGNNYLNFVSADDVARAHLLGLNVNKQGKYLIGAKNLRLREIFSIFGEKLDINPPRSVPTFAAKFYARFLELFGKPKLTTNDVEITKYDFIYDCGKSKELGLRYKEIEKVVDEMLIDFLHRGVLNSKGEKRVLNYLNS